MGSFRDTVLAGPHWEGSCSRQPRAGFSVPDGLHAEGLSFDGGTVTVYASGDGSYRAEHKPHLERYEPGVRRLEPAGVEVEPLQMVLEIDVQPLAPGGARTGHRRGD